MQREIIQKTLYNFSGNFLTLWAEHFSTKIGTCYLHTGRTSSIDTHSFLFLCPSNCKIIREKISPEKKEEFQEYPIYGMLSYEYGSNLYSLKELQDPLFSLFSPSLWLIYSHSSRNIEIFWKESEYDRIHSFFSESTELFESLLNGILPKKTTHELPSCKAKVLLWESETQFCKKVERIRELIHDGDIYQLNLSYEVLLESSSDPFSLFTRVIQYNPSPQSAFLRISETDALISCSPERLLKRDKNILHSQPIKGTKPRGKNQEENIKEYIQLQQCLKERSELSMITDMARNDLFPISHPSSIQVIKAFHIESYSEIFQQLSHITSSALENISPLQALLHMFPGGSITGCPKQQAIKRIHEIEDRNRGVYTGSIGYCLSPTNYDWNIAIRTIILHQASSTMRFSVGSGIVWDSQPKKEYIETIYKAKSFTHICSFAYPDI